MADPISIFGLAVTVGQILSVLYEYGQGVKDAKKDITQLSTELFALKGVLDQIKEKHGDTLPVADGKEVIRSTEDFLQSLLNKLVIPKSTIDKALRSFKWPFDKSDMEKHIARLERVKSWLVLVFMTGVSEDTNEIRIGILNLGRDLREDIAFRREIEMQQKNLDALRWISPIDPQEEHIRRRLSRQRGTGQWFLDQHLLTWLRAAGPSILCLQGNCMSTSRLLWSFADFPKQELENLHFCELVLCSLLPSLIHKT